MLLPDVIESILQREDLLVPLEQRGELSFWLVACSFSIHDGKDSGEDQEVCFWAPIIGDCPFTNQTDVEEAARQGFLRTSPESRKQRECLWWLLVEAYECARSVKLGKPPWHFVSDFTPNQDPRDVPLDPEVLDRVVAEAEPETGFLIALDYYAPLGSTLGFANAELCTTFLRDEGVAFYERWLLDFRDGDAYGPGGRKIPIPAGLLQAGIRVIQSPPLPKDRDGYTEIGAFAATSWAHRLTPGANLIRDAHFAKGNHLYLNWAPPEGQCIKTYFDFWEPPPANPISCLPLRLHKIRMRHIANVGVHSKFLYTREDMSDWNRQALPGTGLDTLIERYEGKEAVDQIILQREIHMAKRMEDHAKNEERLKALQRASVARYRLKVKARQ